MGAVKSNLSPLTVSNFLSTQLVPITDLVFAVVK